MIKNSTSHFIQSQNSTHFTQSPHDVAKPHFIISYQNSYDGGVPREKKNKRTLMKTDDFLL